MTSGVKFELPGELPQRSEPDAKKRSSTLEVHHGTVFKIRLSCSGEHHGTMSEVRNMVVADKIQNLDAFTRISSLKALRANIEKGQTELSQEHVLDLVHALEDDEVDDCRRGAAKVLASLAMRRAGAQMLVPHVERLMKCIEDANEADVVMAIIKALVVFEHAPEVSKTPCGEVIPQMLVSSSKAVLENAIDLIECMITNGFGKPFWHDEFQLQELIVALAHLSTSGEHGMNMQLSAALCLQTLVENGPCCGDVFYSPVRGVKKMLMEEVLVSDIIFEGEQGELLFGILRAAVAHVDRGILHKRFPTHVDAGESTWQQKRRLYYSQARRMLGGMKDKLRMERRQGEAHSQNDEKAEYTKSSIPSLRNIASTFQTIARGRHLGEHFYRQIWENLDEKQMQARELQEQILDREQDAWGNRQVMAGLLREMMCLRSDGGLNDPMPDMEAAIKDIAIVLKEAEQVRSDCLEDIEQIEVQRASLASLNDAFSTIEGAVPEWVAGFQGICDSEASKLDEGVPKLKVTAQRLRSLTRTAAVRRLLHTTKEQMDAASLPVAESGATLKADAVASIQRVLRRLREKAESLAHLSGHLSEERPSTELRSADPFADKRGEHAKHARAAAAIRKRPRNNVSQHGFDRSHLDKAAQDFMHSGLLEEQCFWRLPIIQGTPTSLGRYPQLAPVKQQKHHTMQDDMGGEWRGRSARAVPSLAHSARGGVEVMSSALPGLNMADESPWSKAAAKRHAATADAWRPPDRADHHNSMTSAWRPASKGHRHVATMGAWRPIVDAPTPVNWSCKGWHRVRRGG